MISLREFLFTKFGILGEEKARDYKREYRLHPDGFATNNAGGVLGGISTGQDIRVAIAIKPTSSIMSPKQTTDLHGKSTTIPTKGRHDPCVGIRAAPIAEAMLALVLMDHALRHRAQCGDVSVQPPAIPAARTS